MADGDLSCPFCGFAALEAETRCRRGCPLGAACGLACCPSCGYELPATPPKRARLARLWRRLRGHPPTPPARGNAVTDLEPGARARVLCLGAGTSSRQSSLAVFGLVPGAELTLLQQRPACVLRVGETELAIDPEIARRILVQPDGREAPP